MRRLFQPIALVFIPVLLLLACDPLMPTQPPPAVLIVSPELSETLPPSPTVSPTPSQTPLPSETPNYTPTATPFPCDDDSGQYIDITDNRSAVANENLRYRVYLPPCYQESQKRFPFVILIHGLSYREQQWEDLGTNEALDQGIRLGVLPPMVLIMPFYGTIGQRNQFPPNPSYETVILDELLPEVERDFCLWEDREYRAIGGISRGGFWAYSIAMRHPDIFGAVGGHSAVFPENLNEVPAPFNPLELALNSAILPDSGLRMYLDNGASDSAGPSQQLMSSRLSRRGIPHQYEINPVGDHSNEYWSTHISEYLAFYGANWPRTLDGLPTCLAPSP